MTYLIFLAMPRGYLRVKVQCSTKICSFKGQDFKILLLVLWKRKVNVVKVNLE